MSLQQRITQQELFFTVISVFFSMTLNATVIICLFGLLSSSYSTIIERKKEIGIVRTLGLKGKEIGNIFSYYSNIGVAAIKLTGILKIGDKIHVKGATTDFEQTVDSMQIEGKDVEKAKKGDDIGIKVKDKVSNIDKVFIVE